MERVLIALGIVVVAVAVALVLRGRRRADPPTRASGPVPQQVDRVDFVAPEVPWLVAVFTSATCASCADVRAKAEVLVSEDVAVEIVEFPTRRDLHRRYLIEAVPLVVIADSAGVVRGHFLGPVTATELWAAVAAARDGAR
jgi:hypothetical protein